MTGRDPGPTHRRVLEQAAHGGLVPVTLVELTDEQVAERRRTDGRRSTTGRTPSGVMCETLLRDRLSHRRGVFAAATGVKVWHCAYYAPIGVPVLSSRALHACVQKGWIERSRQRTGYSNSPAVVYQLTDLGRATLEGRSPFGELAMEVGHGQ